MSNLEILKMITKLLSLIVFIPASILAWQEKWDKAAYYMALAIYLWIYLA